jgi:hypothetical protein
MNGTEVPLEEIVYHEAGHAAVACLLGIPIEYVTLEPSEVGPAHTKPLCPRWFQDSQRVDGRHRQYITDLIRMLLAGKFAQQLIDPDIRWGAVGAEVDLEKARTWLDWLYTDPEDRNWCWEQCHSEVLAPVQSAKGRMAIETVAEALLRRRMLRGEEVRKIVERRIGRE